MKISKIKHSRDGWKEKAKKRGSTIRNLKKSSKAQKRREDKKVSNGDDLRRLKKGVRPQGNLPVAFPETDFVNQQSPCAITVPQRTLCVLIVIVGIVSFRSVPRILKVFLPFLMTQLKIPHFTSV